MRTTFLTALLLASIFAVANRCAATTVITAFNNTFCSTAYPTAYTSGSIKIAASTAGAFNANQAALKMDIVAPANFVFNMGSAPTLVFASGQSITSASAVVLNSRRIRLTISTANVSNKLDTLTISFQVKALSSPITVSTSTLKRSDSTDLATAARFKVDGSTSKPSGSFGKLNSNNALAYASSSAFHPTTAAAYSASVNNQILCVPVVVSGVCGSKTITGIAFNTDGGNGTGSTNPSTDVLNAKVYSTGTSSTFATTSLFGTAVAPNGAFTVTGSKAITAAGTYYFWLTYDVSGTAISNDKLDAQITGLTVDGTSYTDVATPSPTGSRTVSTQYYYSRATGNWNSTSAWSYTNGGISCSCYPNGNAYVVINTGHTITVNGNYTADVVDIQTGGVLKDNAITAPIVQQNILTNGTGYFLATSSWTVNGGISTSGTGTSTISKPITVSGNLSIGAGTTLSLSGTGDLTAAQGLTVNGTLAAGTRTLVLSGTGASIDGNGSVTGSGSVSITAAKSIAGTAALSIAPPVSIGSGVTVQNNGSVTLSGNLVGNASSSTWTNASGSSLSVAGTLLSTGTLVATASGNLVSYNGTAAQTVKATTYDDLKVGNAVACVKTLGGNVTVNDDLTISGAGTLDASVTNYAITVAGDWINNSSAATPFNARSGTVTFNGNSVITGNAVAFNNITITGALSASSGTTTVSGNFANNGSFEDNNGLVVFNGSTTVSGSAVTEFKRVTVNALSTLTAHATETDIAGDFTLNGTFNANNGTVKFNGSSAQTVGGLASPTFQNVTINGGGVSLAVPASVNGTLTMTQGNLVTSSLNALTLNNGAGVSGGSSASFVKGPLVFAVAASGTTVITFPTGKGTASFRPITLTVNHSDNAAAYYTAEMFNASAVNLNYALPATINLVSSARYYVIHRTGASNLQNARVQFTYGSDDGVSDPSHLHVVKTIGSALAWNDVGGSTSGGAVTSNWFTSFSTFALANGLGGSNVLPITLSAFTATCDGGNVDLNWTTESEINGDRFDVERSDDGTSFTSVAEVDATGNSEVQQHYATVDANVATKALYYRLKSIDNDGSFSYSNIVPITCADASAVTNELQVYPNPIVGSVLRFRFSQPVATAVAYCVKNIIGVTVAEGKITDGANPHDIQLDELPAGSYWVTVHTANAAYNKQLLVKR